MMKIAEKEYKKILSTIPIICVDLLIKKKDQNFSINKFLLMKRVNEPFKGKWWVPGGRVYKNETLSNAVKRKCKEECNLVVDKLKRVGLIEYIDVKAPFKDIQEGVHVISVVYEVTPKQGEVVLDEQHEKFDWFSKEEFPKELSSLVFCKKELN